MFITLKKVFNPGWDGDDDDDDEQMMTLGLHPGWDGDDDDDDDEQMMTSSWCGFVA